MSNEAKTPFKAVQEEKTDRMYIVVEGLGTVRLNRTDEGLIVDVWNSDDTEVVDTMALECNDFL